MATLFCYFVLNVVSNQSLLTMTYLMPPLHSLVDNLRMRNRCRQKEGVTLSLNFVCNETTSFSSIAVYPLSL